MKQLQLIPKPLNYHGGQLRRGRRKIRRPLSTKRSIHLVLKCHNSMDLFGHREYVNEKISTNARRFGVKLYSRSVQRDHIHLLMKFPCRQSYVFFVRSLASVLARRFSKGMWKCLPFSRVVQWGKDFRGVLSYLRQNDLEVRGLVAYSPRRHKYLT